MKYVYRPRGVCSVEISFELDGDVEKNVAYTGGCNGNLKAVSKLIDGHTVDYVVDKLAGNTCRYRNTSCADQLAIALKMAYEGALDPVG